jgi:hypothetical protein
MENKPITVPLNTIYMTPEGRDYYYWCLARAFITEILPSYYKILGDPECITLGNGGLYINFQGKRKEADSWEIILTIELPPKSWSFKALS